MRCIAATVHDGHTHQCTIEPSPHPGVKHMAPCDGGKRLHRWDDVADSTDPAPDLMAALKASLVRPSDSGIEPTPTPTRPKPITPDVPGVQRVIRAAADAGWSTVTTHDVSEAIATGRKPARRVHTIRVALQRGDESGRVTYVREDPLVGADGAEPGDWRFGECTIAGQTFGARGIAARLAKQAVPGAPAEPAPAVVYNMDDFRAAQNEEWAREERAGAAVAAVGEGIDTDYRRYMPPPPSPLVPPPVIPTSARALAPPPPTAPTIAMPAVPGALADFMSAKVMGGNTPWAARYGAELRRVVHEHARSSVRNLQVHLGPSELGVPCDRQVAGKLARIPATNHVADPWPSVLGTAAHAWFAEAFAADNARHGLRWVPERKVTPHPEHSGTADLYDGLELAVVDHKVLGKTTHAKLVDKGPPIWYEIQLLLYGKGYRNLGLPVKRVVLAAYPRTEHTLDNLYVWEREARPDDDQVIEEVFKLTWIRKQYAADIIRNKITLMDVPAQPDSTLCFYCPFYRPQSIHDGGLGCPGKSS